MVKVTRLNGQEVYVNADLIMFLEKSPDTVLTLQNGKKIMVKEPIVDVIERIVTYKGRCLPTIVTGQNGETR